MKAIETPAVITSISSRTDRSLRFSTETPELTSDEKALFMELQGLNLNMTIKPVDETVEATQEIKSEAEPKTRAERLQAVLWVLWDQKYRDKYSSFSDFYNAKMDRWIGDIKSLLDK